MAPRFVAGKLLELLRGANIGVRPDALKRAVERDQLLERIDAVLHPLDYGLQVLVTAVGEGVEVNAGSVARVGRCQVHGAGVVAALSLEDEPGPFIVLGRGIE